MNHLHLIISSRWKIIATSITSMRLLRIASFVFVISCFLVGAYYLFFRVFGYVATVEVIGHALMDRIIEMAFFVFFIMLVFSNVITSFSTFFNNRELEFLFTLPVQPTSIYLVKLLESCTYASWATMVVALPLVAAYGVVMRAPVFYYPIAASSIFIYIIIPAVLASMFIFAIFRFLPRLTSRDVIILSLVLISGLTFLYVKVNNPALLKIFETENEQELLQFAANLTTVGGTYVPSTWLSNILRGCNKDLSQGIFYFLLLLFVTLSTVIIAFFVARVLYAQSWLLVGERGTQRKKRISILSRGQAGATKALLAKDILLFVREPTQWVQLFIFVILLAVYIFSLRRTRSLPSPILPTSVLSSQHSGCGLSFRP
jgi:ABC-2 type transport system permease protein